MRLLLSPPRQSLPWPDLFLSCCHWAQASARDRLPAISSVLDGGSTLRCLEIVPPSLCFRPYPRASGLHSWWID